MACLIKFWTVVILVLIENQCLYQTSLKVASNYQPNWDSLDKRPLPEWYDEAKIGIFMHWGVYSVPSFAAGENSPGEWFWSHWKEKNSYVMEFMDKFYPKSFTYQEFAADFKAEFFNATGWAELFKNAGAKYIVITSKHHEGFTLWPSKYTFGWNSVDLGPKRDILGELSEATRKIGLNFGTYYSLFEWFNPIYNLDKAKKFRTQEYVLNKMLPEITDLVNRYKPSVIWADGDWEAEDTYWNSTHFLAWLYNESPVKDRVVVNDRWGRGTSCKHGDFYSCQDRYNPGVLQKHKWEATATVDIHSWGFRRNAQLSDYMTSYQLINETIQAVSCGGNMLINVGPTKEGTISPIMQERLLDLGKWLKMNGEGIYGSKPWKYQNDTSDHLIWYTMKADSVYAFILKWPAKNIATLKSATMLFKNGNVTVRLLEYDTPLRWSLDNEEVNIQLPDKAQIGSELAWVIKITTPINLILI